MKRHLGYIIIMAVFSASLVITVNTGKVYSATLKLENYNGGFFTIERPKGWNLITSGNCSTFAFVIRDPSEPLRQVFYFGEVGPVYMSHEQKQIDWQYMQMGGYPVTWIEMPVVIPLTPANFLVQFQQIARTRIAQQFMPQCPRLDNLQVISSSPYRSQIQGGSTELVRALFTEQGRVGEGLFMVTVAPMIPFSGGPGGGIACGFMITGVTAPKKEFRHLEKVLVKSVASFSISQKYVDRCLQEQARTYAAIRRAGRTLSETSDIITRGWENRNRTYDIISEKRSDAILGRERLYNPDTGEVYEFENGFYDKYSLNKNRYEMNNLKPLPDSDYDLWMKAPLDGHRNIR